MALPHHSFAHSGPHRQHAPGQPQNVTPDMDDLTRVLADQSIKTLEFNNSSDFIPTRLSAKSHPTSMFVLARAENYSSFNRTAIRLFI
ncbi:unnamed protein product [Cutaneotrichosporon oleaginosum]